MALRSPIYLDAETLLAQAEYHELDVPRRAEIVEKTVRERGAQAKASITGIGASGSAGRTVEYQATYDLTPTLKSTVSKLIDSLISQGAVKPVEPAGSLSKDDLVELEGATRITAASLAGKAFYILRRFMQDTTQDLSKLAELSTSDPELVRQIKAVYVDNALPPIPMLLEMTQTGLPQRVYVNLRPDHFVEAASADRVEGELRVLGTVSRLVPGGDDGFTSAEDWLLAGYEYLFRRTLMTKIDDMVDDLVGKLGLELPADDVHAYIAGPAIVIDAIAVY
jgi:hypothetical protein